MNQDYKLQILLGIFVAVLIAMNLLGGKITSLFGVSVSVAIFMVPLTFLITDIVEEVHGTKLARRFVIIGVITQAIVFGFVALSIALPPHERYQLGQEFRAIFQTSLRIIVASMIAFFISQTHDVWAFNFWKQKTGGRFLWLRNNASTMVSQAIDTLLFLTLAFYQATPLFTFGFILELFVPFYLFKVAFAALDTPFVYLGVRWLRSSSSNKN